MTPGGMSRDLGNSYSSGRHGVGGAAVGGSKGKKATTLFLMPTLLSRIARKFPSTFSRSVNVRRLGRKPFRWEFSLLPLADIVLRSTNQNLPRSCIQYRYIFTQIKGAATNKTYSVFQTYLPLLMHNKILSKV
jgi:hypothetical protein